MARSGILAFAGLLNSVARAAARRQRVAEAERRRQARVQLQAERAAAYRRTIQSKGERQRYVEEQIAVADERTAELTHRVAELREVLQATPYQLKQLLHLVERYNLTLGEHE